MVNLFDRAAVAELVGELNMDELTFAGAIELFETVYMASRNLSARTREEYKRDVQQLADFLAKRSVAKPEQVSLSHLQAFLADLDTKGLTGVTRRRKTASIKAFLDFSPPLSLSRATPLCSWCPLNGNIRSRGF
jgi:site-specific recombinase XerD